MKNEIEFDNLMWMLEVEPELYSGSPRKYMIRKKDYGLYTKKEAEIICEFLRKSGAKIIYDNCN